MQIEYNSGMSIEDSEICEVRFETSIVVKCCKVQKVTGSWLTRTSEGTQQKLRHGLQLVSFDIENLTWGRVFRRLESDALAGEGAHLLFNEMPACIASNAMRNS